MQERGRKEINWREGKHGKKGGRGRKGDGEVEWRWEGRMEMGR